MHVDVIIIGAGPSGSVAAKLLADRGHSVLILERATFPRFSIGESLLPQCTGLLEEAGMLDVVQKANFQLKNGALFQCGEKISKFDFNEKFSEGPGSTFEVQRDHFDKLLADESEKSGVLIHYAEEITAANLNQDVKTVESKTLDGKLKTYTCQFVLDASGFGRVLPRLLELDKPTSFPKRQSIFTHIKDNISCSDYDRDKIIIAVHPHYQGVWYWLIPFSDETCSIGVVATEAFFDTYEKDKIEDQLITLVSEEPGLNSLLQNAQWHTPIRKITGYAVSVKGLHGNGYALLGNAGEFIDPIFSSGVTIALKSAILAVRVLDKQLNDENVDWDIEYSVPLYKGINVFREFVESWYKHELQDIIFSPVQTESVRQKICSILAGYAWDETNSYVRDTKRTLRVLAEACQEFK